jgi:hypothetical protein
MNQMNKSGWRAFSASCSAVLGETDKIQVIVMIRENRFRLVAEAHEQVNVSGSPQHGAGIELMGVGRGLFDFL